VQGMVVGVWVSWFSSSWWQVYVDMDFVRIVQVEGEREGEKRGGIKLLHRVMLLLSFFFLFFSAQ